jgi:glucokinase
MRETPGGMALRGGIDLGGTKIQAVIVGDRNGIRGQNRIPTPKDGGPEAVIAGMADAVRAAAEQARVQTSDLDGVGIGSPGDVDPASGTVSNAYNVVPD